jgi:ATP-dependent Clp protease ATP-binding subunit ClpA
VRDAQVPVSAICQAALERAVRDVHALRASDEAPASSPDHGPFLGFTPRARRAIELGQHTAAAHKHPRVDTEHLLLGVLEEGSNLAISVLGAIEIEPDDLRRELEASLGPPERSTSPSPPFTPLAKKALELTTIEAQSLGHNYVGCEHLLLGLLAVEDGLASVVLRRMGVELRTTRRAVITALVGFLHQRERKVRPSRTVDSAHEEILARLDAIERRLQG